MNKISILTDQKSKVEKEKDPFLHDVALEQHSKNGIFDVMPQI
jgi:hypothetical protein